MCANLIALVVFGLAATIIGVLHLVYDIWRDGNLKCFGQCVKKPASRMVDDKNARRLDRSLRESVV